MTEQATKLEALNEILAIIGESPVESLVSELPQDAELALGYLDRAIREGLVEGWHFNTDLEVEYVPDSSGEILLDDSVVRVGLLDRSSSLTLPEVTARSGKLYNPRKATFVFDGPVYVERTVLLNFTDCPQAFRNYVTKKAGRQLYATAIGESQLFSILLQDETLARKELERHESLERRPTMLSTRTSLNIWPRSTRRKLY
jgi:hypothetical protein